MVVGRMRRLLDRGLRRHPPALGVPGTDIPRTMPRHSSENPLRPGPAGGPVVIPRPAALRSTGSPDLGWVYCRGPDGRARGTRRPQLDDAESTCTRSLRGWRSAWDARRVNRVPSGPRASERPSRRGLPCDTPEVRAEDAVA